MSFIHIIVVIECPNGDKCSTEELVERAISYYNYIEKHSKDTVYILFAGEEMKEFAVNKGADPDFILVKNKSRTPSENILFSGKIIQEKFNTEDISAITICLAPYMVGMMTILANHHLKDYNLNFICPKFDYVW